jgi:hypothetical protein
MMDVHGNDRVQVGIKSIGGFLMLTAFGNFPIQVLCSSLPEATHEVFVHFNRFSITKELVSILGLDDLQSGVSDSLKKILNSNMLLHYEDEDEKPFLEDNKKVEINEENELDRLLDSGQDDGLEFDLDDMLAELNFLPEEIGDPPPVSIPPDDHDDYDLDRSEWLSSSQVGSYISQYGVFQPTSTLLSTRAYGQIKMVPQAARRNIPLAIRTEKTVCISLPFKTNEKAYASGPTGTGLTELVSELINNDSADSAWFISYLRDCLVNSSYVMMEVKEVLKEDSQEQDEDW